MKLFTEKKFNIKELKGISKKNIDEHLGLYSGYVKNTNLILQKLEELRENIEKNQYPVSELQRRFSFEFCGMRNHEYYFSLLERNPKNELNSLSKESFLNKKIIKDFNNFDSWLSIFKNIAITRGVGWAMLYYDKKSDQLLNAWIDEQHQGILTGLSPILTLDMWEHSYITDYTSSGKKKYIEDFFENINWSIIENNLKESIK